MGVIEPGFGMFPTTEWPLVERAAQSRDPRAREALDALLRRYLPAMRLFLVQRMHIPGDPAEDLLQGFISSRVLERHLIAQANQSRGKFRTFLLCSLRNYVISQIREQKALKRSPEGHQVLSLDEFQAIDAAEPGDAFEAEWAQTVLQEAIRRLQARCTEGRREDLWGVFEARVLRPALSDEPPLTYAALVQRFNLESPAQAANLLMTAKRMLNRLLRAVIGEYAATPADVEEELQDLRRILGRRGNGGR